MTQSEFDNKMILIDEKEQAAIKPLVSKKANFEAELYNIRQKRLALIAEENRLGYEIMEVSRSIQETRITYRAKRNEIKREFNTNKELDF